MSRLDSPRASRPSTSSSRGVSCSSRGSLGRRRWGGPSYERVDHAAGHSGRQQGLPRRHHPDGSRELLGGRVLEQEAGGAGAQRLEDVLVEVEGGQHQHPRLDAGLRRAAGSRRCRRARASGCPSGSRPAPAARPSRRPPRRSRPRRPPRSRARRRAASGTRPAPCPGRRRSPPGWSCRCLLQRQAHGEADAPVGEGARSTVPPYSATRSRMPTRPWPPLAVPLAACGQSAPVVLDLDVEPSAASSGRAPRPGWRGRAAARW